jgi:hypothetical protein
MGGILLAAGIVLHVAPQVWLTPPGPKEVQTLPGDEQVPQPPAGTPPTKQSPPMPKPPVQAPIEEKEPNNSITAAALITEGTTVRGSLASNEDRDFFKFNASSTKTRVIVRKQDSMAVDVSDHVEHQVANRAAALDTTITLSFKSTPGSIYYILVKHSLSIKRGGDYELLVQKE